MPKYQVELTVLPAPIAHTIEVEAADLKAAKLAAFRQYRHDGVVKIGATGSLQWWLIEGIETAKTSFITYECADSKEAALEQFRLRERERSISNIAEGSGGSYGDYPDDQDYEVDVCRPATEREQQDAQRARLDPH